MKNEDLLKAIGQIDDEFVEAAETKRDSKKAVVARGVAGNGGVKFARRSNLRVFAKSFACVAALLVLCIGVGTLTGAFRMGASKSADTEMAYEGAGNSGMGYYDVDMMEAPMAIEEFSANSAVKLKEGAQVNDLERTAERAKKLIYRSWVDVQTTNFDETVKELNAMVESYGGYLESSNVNNGSYYDDQVYKNGYYSVKIPVENYQAFMSNACSQWHVSSKNENLEDITKAYYELVDRIDTLEIKEDKLHELLKKASNLSDIITLENELSNNEYELNQLKNSLASYDQQVTYASIEISINQVTQVGSSIGSEGFGARMIRALKNGIRNFAEGIADFVVWMGYNVIEIIIVIAVIIIIRKFHLLRRFINWIKE